MAIKIRTIVYYWKTKGLLFKQKCFWKNNLKQYSWSISAGSSFFEEKLMKHFSYCEKTIARKFEIKQSSFAKF